MMRTNYFLETILIAGRAKTLTAFGLLAAMVALLTFGPPAPESAHAQTSTDPKTFTVNSTADAADKNRGDGSCFTGTLVDFGEGAIEECTLRAAIQEANAHLGADTIAFNIPGNEVKTIPLRTSLPSITDAVTIDGYTQPGAKPNTQEVGNDAVLLIELRPSVEVSKSGGGTGLELYAPNSVVRGLVINRFVVGVQISGPGTSKLEGNFIGTDASGTTAPSDGANTPQRLGVYLISGSNKTIGGTLPAARNVISGNEWGVLVEARLRQSPVQDNKIQGNYIGTTKDGTGALGNNNGVTFTQANFGGLNTRSTGSPKNNVVGGVYPGGMNTIAFNRDRGVWVGGSSTGNRILYNSIHSNGGLGIDLGGVGVAPNDPGDPDTGSNNHQNYPELTSAMRNADGTVTISGKLDSTRGRTFLIQFFSSPDADPSGFGEGKTLLAPQRDFPITINREGTNLEFTFAGVVPLQPPSSGDQITATATDEETGDTSEFSNAVTVVSDDEFEWEDETF